MKKTILFVLLTIFSISFLSAQEKGPWSSWIRGCCKGLEYRWRYNIWGDNPDKDYRFDVEFRNNISGTIHVSWGVAKSSNCRTPYRVSIKSGQTLKRDFHTKDFKPGQLINVCLVNGRIGEDSGEYECCDN